MTVQYIEKSFLVKFSQIAQIISLTCDDYTDLFKVCTYALAQLDFQIINIVTIAYISLLHSIVATIQLVSISPNLAHVIVLSVTY